MGGERTQRIEAGVDSVAAGLFASGTAVVLLLLNASGVYVTVATAVSFAGCLYGLRSINPGYADFALPCFEVQEFEAVEVEELVLAETDLRPAPEATEPLVLDDILAQIGPDSRVVRLFDRDAMPTPGQLKARIDQHLGDSDNASVPQDASQALREALAELRRSLR